jgi:hypothetical protein
MNLQKSSPLDLLGTYNGDSAQLSAKTPEEIIEEYKEKLEAVSRLSYLTQDNLMNLNV